MFDQNSWIGKGFLANCTSKCIFWHFHVCSLLFHCLQITDYQNMVCIFQTSCHFVLQTNLFFVNKSSNTWIRRSIENKPAPLFIPLNLRRPGLFMANNFSTAKRILERLGIQTSSSFAKILQVCIPKFKVDFLSFLEFI